MPTMMGDIKPWSCGDSFRSRLARRRINIRHRWRQPSATAAEAAAY